MRNELIEASAGTGKTHALVERLVAALHEGARADEIAALTFSRAAAGEIFTRFVRRLADGTGEAGLLRQVIATQHLSQIGTIDAFLMRFVQMFPLELGLSGEVSVASGYGQAHGESAIALAVLRKRDEAFKKLVVEAFRLTALGRAQRSFRDPFAKFVALWHPLFLSHLDPEAWGRSRPCAFTTVPTVREIRALAATLEGFSSRRGAATFIAKLAAFDGVIPPVPKALADERAVQAAVRLMQRWKVAEKMSVARGIFSLMAAFEAEYARCIRMRGHLTFADFPRLVARLGDGARLALEYRLDAKFRHWALDEFQDTSHEQWAAMSNLLDEARQGDGSSVFIVGDTKQAIYGWRHGDVAIFAHERDSGRYDLRELNESYRYGPEIAEAVNRVFGGRNMARFGLWHCPNHVAHCHDRAGFVQTVETEDRTQDAFVAPLANALKAVRPWEKGLTCAVLVRGNTFGEMLGAALRREDIPVVWEGESALLDTPVLRAFTALVRLAEHPGDEIAYNHLRLSPLGRALYPDGVPAPEQVSREMLSALTARGLVRTFQDAKARLAAEAWDVFTESRFADMLRAAAAFEAGLEPGTRLNSFIDFLEAERRRDFADTQSVRIMTIHRAKGLGFDYVLLPLYEPHGLDVAPEDPLVGADWVMPCPGEEVALATPEIAPVYARQKDANIYEGLCVYYVAMTRAKRALTVLIPPPAKTKTKTTRFSDFVRESDVWTIGDPAWRKTASPAPCAQADGTVPDAPASGLVSQGIVRAPRIARRRSVPSKTFKSGMTANTLFARAQAREDARTRGADVHTTFEAVEWLSPHEASTALERALVKPADFVELWRERAYEVHVDGAWESGQFDRVVFARDASGELYATVYDYKTNAVRPGEDEMAFAARLRDMYLPQMRHYRRAVARLAALPETRVRAVLLTTANGGCLNML